MKSIRIFLCFAIIASTSSTTQHGSQLRGGQTLTSKRRPLSGNNVHVNHETNVVLKRNLEEVNSTSVNLTTAPTQNPTTTLNNRSTTKPTNKRKIDALVEGEALSETDANSTTAIIPGSSPVPTKFPRNLPSNLPSQMPTTIPTNLPTGTPTNLPTAMMTRTPTRGPTVVISENPSYNPSKVPTAMPSNYPVQLQSNFPSSTPISLPSIQSIPPSNIPSNNPTVYSEELGTGSNHLYQSNTYSCEDLDSYRSPINKNLTCSDHKGTDCRKWIVFEAMNENAIVDLLRSCPYSCNVPCGNRLFGFSEKIQNVWNSLELDAGNESNSSLQETGSTTVILSSLVVITILGVAVGFTIRRRNHWNVFTNLSPKHKKDGHELPIIKSPSDSDGIENGSVDHSFLSRVLYNHSHESDENPSGLLSRIGGTLTNENHENNEEVKRDNEEDLQMSPAHFIPPMIVINNIEDDEIPVLIKNEGTGEDVSPAQVNRSNQYIKEENKLKSAIPIKHIEASSALAAALASQRINNPLPAYNLFWSRSKEEMDESGLDHSPHSLLSARPSIGETASAVSTPSTVHTQNESGRKESKGKEESSIFIFDQENEIEPEDDFSVLFEKSMKVGDKAARSFSLRGLFQKQKKLDENLIDDGKLEQLEQNYHYESDANSSDVSTVLRERDRREDLQLSSSQSSGVSDSGSCDRNDENNGSPFSLSHGYVDKDETIDSTELSDGVQLQNVCESPNPRSIERRCSDRVFSPSKNEDNGYLYTFLAPCYGKLGITVETKASALGPTIHQVKDYSPLFGMVQPGDKIVAIDGEETSNMDTSLLTDLLSKRRFENRSNDGNIKISVSSRERKHGFAAEKAVEFEARDDIDQAMIESKEIETKQNDQTFIRNHLVCETFSGDEGDCHLMAGGDQDFM